MKDNEFNFTEEVRKLMEQNEEVVKEALMKTIEKYKRKGDADDNM